jgi:hypothetical protein
MCAGVVHQLLDRALDVNPRYVLKYWNIVNGCTFSKSCNVILGENDTRDGMPSCSKCRISYSNIRRDRYPLLFDDNESVPDKYAPNCSTIERELQRFWKSEACDEEKFRMRPEVNFLCRLMVFRGDTGVVVLDTTSGDEKFLICCKNASQKHPLCQPVGAAFSEGALDLSDAPKGPEVRDGCQLFSVVRRRKDQAGCATCKTEVRNRKRRRDSREKDVGRRFCPGSHVNHSFYSPEGAQKLIKIQATEIRKSKLLLQKATESLKNKTETISESDEGFALVHDLIEHASRNKKDFRRLLLYSLVESEHAERNSSSDKLSEADCKEFVSTVLTEVDNFIHKKNNNEKQCRFSPAVLRLSMNLYNKSPGAYAEFRAHSIFAFPSESTMKKRRQANRLEEGFNPIIYCRHVAQRTSYDSVEHGHIG